MQIATLFLFQPLPRDGVSDAVLDNYYIAVFNDFSCLCLVFARLDESRSQLQCHFGIRNAVAALVVVRRVE